MSSNKLKQMGIHVFVIIQFLQKIQQCSQSVFFFILSVKLKKNDPVVGCFKIISTH